MYAGRQCDDSMIEPIIIAARDSFSGGENMHVIAAFSDSFFVYSTVAAPDENSLSLYSADFRAVDNILYQAAPDATAKFVMINSQYIYPAIHLVTFPSSLLLVPLAAAGLLVTIYFGEQSIRHYARLENTSTRIFWQSRRP